MKNVFLLFTIISIFLINPKSIVALERTDPRCSSDGDYVRIDTALGCIPTNPQKFVEDFFPWAIGIAGTAAFLLLAFGAFSHITAAGNPEKLQKSKETITAAIAGLVIIIFSVLLLGIITGDVLGIPGFKRQSPAQEKQLLN